MLSLQVQFSADRQTDTVKQYAPDLLMQGHKNFFESVRPKYDFCSKLSLRSVYCFWMVM